MGDLNTEEEDVAETKDQGCTQEAWGVGGRDEELRNDKQIAGDGKEQLTLEANEGDTNVRGSDENDHSMQKVIIDCEDNDSKEKADNVDNALYGLPYQDHDYGVSSGQAQRNEGENGEKFPVIGGLSSYISQSETDEFTIVQRVMDSRGRQLYRMQCFDAENQNLNESNGRAAVGSYPTARLNQSLGRSVPCAGSVFSRQMPVTAVQNYRLPPRGSGMSRGASVSSHNEALFRPRRYVGRGETCGSSPVPSSRKFLRPAYASNYGVTSQDGREMIPVGKSIGSPVITTSTPSEKKMESAAPRKSTSDSSLQTNSALHVERQPDINSIAHLQKCVTRMSDVTKQHYMMAEPLEPCHVPLQRVSEQHAASSVEPAVITTLDETSGKDINSKSSRDAATDNQSNDQEAVPEGHANESHEVTSEIKLTDEPHMQQGDTASQQRPLSNAVKFSAGGSRKYQKGSIVANSRELFSRQLDELQMNQNQTIKKLKVHSARRTPVDTFSQRYVSERKETTKRTGQDANTYSRISSSSLSLLNDEFSTQYGERQNLSLPDAAASVKSQIQIAPTAGKSAMDDLAIVPENTVEDTSSGDEPLITSNDPHNVTAKQRICGAMRSSASGAEEEISINGNADEKESDGDVRSMEAATACLNSADSSSENEWSEEYTTRCYCGLSHNDDFMIQCDGCNVWQHGKCMGIDRRCVPDIYKCEQCCPRTLKLSVTKARNLQLKMLSRKRREKMRRRRQKGILQRKKEVAESVGSVKRGRKKKLKECPYGCFKYEYSRSVLAFSRKHEDTGDPTVLEALREHHDDVSVMFVTPNSKGLVSTRQYECGEPVIYVCGRVSLASECTGREEGTIVPFVFLYSGLELGEAKEPTPICVDARRFGSNARYARPSCRPNIKLQHLFLNGKLHIIGTASVTIERGDEVTVPFDSDYLKSKHKLVCACSADDDDDRNTDCPILNFNRSLECKSSAQEVNADSDAAASASRIRKHNVMRRRTKRGGKKSVANENRNIKARRVRSSLSSSSSALTRVCSVEGGQAATETVAAGHPNETNRADKDPVGSGPSEISSDVAESSAFLKNPVKMSSERKRGSASNVRAAKQSKEKRGRRLSSIKEPKEQFVKEDNPEIRPELKVDGAAKVGDEVKLDVVASESSNLPEGSKKTRKRRVISTGQETRNEAECVQRPRRNACRKRRQRAEVVEDLDPKLPDKCSKTMSREDRKVLQELALFERMQQRETKRQQHVASKLEDGGCPESRATSVNVKSQDSDATIKGAVVVQGETMNGNGQRKKRGRKPKKEKDQRNVDEVKKSKKESTTGEEVIGDVCKKSVSFSLDSQSSTPEYKSKCKADVRDEHDVGEEAVKPQQVSPTMDSTMTVGGISPALLRTGTEILGVNVSRTFNGNTKDSDNIRKSEKMDPPLKRKRYSQEKSETNSSQIQVSSLVSNSGNGDSQLSVIAKTGEVRNLFDEVSKMEAACSSSDFFLDFQMLDGVHIPSTSDVGSIKSPKDTGAIPKKKVSLDEYKKRKSSKHAVSSDTLKAVSTENKPEKQEMRVPSHSFIPTVNVNEGSGRRTSLRLGALPDPTQLRALPTPSIDDLKRRIYKRSVPTPILNVDNVASPLSQSSPGTASFSQFSKEKNACTSSVSSLRPKTPPPPPPFSPPFPTVNANSREERMSLDERLRLVLGVVESEGDNHSSLPAPAAAAPSAPPPPAPPAFPFEGPSMSTVQGVHVGAFCTTIPLPPDTSSAKSSSSQPKQQGPGLHRS